MTAPLRHPVIANIDPLLAFKARAEARAILWAACEYDLHDAVDPLQAAAVSTGLVDKIGQDAVQAIMARAFHTARKNNHSAAFELVSFAESCWSAPGWREAAEEYHAARVPT
jgi:hypothetical protein